MTLNAKKQLKELKKNRTSQTLFVGAGRIFRYFKH